MLLKLSLAHPGAEATHPAARYWPGYYVAETVVAQRDGNAFTGRSGYSIDLSDFITIERAKVVAARQVAKHRAAGRDQSVSALKYRRRAAASA